MEDVVQENKKLRIAVYCRAETREECEEFVESYMKMIGENKDWIFVGKYVDVGLSGRSAVTRKAFRRLIVECEKSGVDIILTPSVSQFSRNTLDLLKYIKTLKARNVEVRFEKENVKSTIQTENPLTVTFNRKT